MLELKPEAASRKPQASSSKLFKEQAASIKPQAASIKLQAASNKRLDLLSFIKFNVSSSEALGYDKSIQGMSDMKCNLVWWEA